MTVLGRLAPIGPVLVSLTSLLFVLGTPEPRYGSALLSSVFLLASFAVVWAVGAVNGVVSRSGGLTP